MKQIKVSIKYFIIKKYVLIFLSIIFIKKIAFSQISYPFQNPDLPVEERINSIISILTLEEKIACLSTNPGVERLGIKGTRHVEGLHGLARGGPRNWGRRDPVATTIFPQAIGLAESWDPEVLKTVASVEGYEARYLFQNPAYRKGGLIVRAPNADMGRDIRWGRNEECYGEDPFLNSVMTTAFVRGLQGEDSTYWLTASLMKHFLANSNESGRDSTSSDFDERLWREYYSFPFMKGVTEGGSRAFMTAYNAYNGIPCTVHPMLKNITVNEWGQNGIICTDGGALRLLVSAHKAFPDLEHAAAACIKAGITQFLDQYVDAVKGALNNGLITETEIDSVIKGNFRVMIKLGLLDPPEMVSYSSIGVSDTLEPWLKEDHRRTAREVTRKTIVLLKNSNNMLPINRENLRSIAVLGPLADSVLLDWYSGSPPYRISPAEGIRRNVNYQTRVNHYNGNNLDTAIDLAKNADFVIICAGNHPVCNYAGWGICPTPSDGREAVDRKSIILEQEEFIKQIYAVNPKTILVLISSFPFAINWSQDNLPAILHMTHCSQELGNALADVLFGDYNPAGRLVQTWPASIDQLPPMMDYNIRNGKTYLYFRNKPLYPFGYGLSYTTFDYSNLRLDSKSLHKDGTITVSLNLTNTGQREGEEVVQLYVKHLNSNITRPLLELKGFKRVTVAAGKTKTVNILLKAESLAYWNGHLHSFDVETDKVKLMIGSSSRDIRLTKTVRIEE